MTTAVYKEFKLGMGQMLSKDQMAGDVSSLEDLYYRPGFFLR